MPVLCQYAQPYCACPVLPSWQSSLPHKSVMCKYGMHCYGTMEADAEHLCVAHSTFRSSWPSPDVSWRKTLCFLDLTANLRFTRELQHYLIVRTIPLYVGATSEYVQTWLWHP